MSSLAQAVRELADEISEAREAAALYDDGATETVDALAVVHAALVNLLAVANGVLDNWNTA